jgi:hypothetical protein
MQQQNTEQNQEHSDVYDFQPVVMVPNIEDNVPLPKNSHEALPSLSPEEELQLRATTIKEISDIVGEPIEPSPENKKQAEDIARDMIENPGKKQEFGLFPNETITFLAGMVGSMNHMIVKDLADLKLYVVNHLVKIVETTDNAKEKTAALRAIGEVDGVDAFKKKTEVTHKVETMEEVEKELLSMLTELKQKGLIKPPPQTVDAEFTTTTIQTKDKEKTTTTITYTEETNTHSDGDNNDDNADE